MIETVNHNYIHQIWPLVGGMISRAIEFSGGEYSADHLRMMLVRGEQVLYIATQDENIVGAATVEFMNCPNDRVALITSIAGRMIANAPLFDEFKIALRKVGCTKFKGEARASVARLWHQKLGIESIRFIVEGRL